MSFVQVFLATLLFFTPCVSSFPVATPPEDTASPFIALWISLPFVFLASLKIAYMKFRRAQSIHSCDPHRATESLAARPLSGLGFDVPQPRTHHRLLPIKPSFTGYIVGFLGSPDWETKITRRVDRVVRKTQSVASASPMIFHPGNRSSVSGGTRTSGGAGDVSRTNNTSSSRRQSRATTGSRRSRTASISFLEMQTPNLHDITSCNSVHPFSPACLDPSFTPLELSGRPVEGRPGGQTRRQRHCRPSFSPTPVSRESPLAPAPTEEHALDKSTKSSNEELQSRLCNKSGSASESNVSSEFIPSICSKEREINLSYPHISSSPLIDPDSSAIGYLQSISESLHEVSHITGPDEVRSADWSTGSVEVMKVPRRDRTPSLKAPSSPLSPSLKANVTIWPMPPMGRDYGSCPDQLKPASLSPKNQDTTHPGQSRIASAGGAAPAITMRDWVLGDLLRDGKIDVDAVNGVLGLDFAFLDDTTPNSDSIFGDNSQVTETSLNRDSTTRDTPCNISLEMLLRKPGALLCVIPEETEDAEDGSSRPNSNRWSRVSGDVSAPYTTHGEVGASVDTWVAA